MIAFPTFPVLSFGEGANNKDGRKNYMQNKKLYMGLGFFILLVGVAAFVAGRMLNRNTGTVGLGGPNSGQVSISIDEITPAPELPVTRADITGLFIERQDNTIIVQAVSFDVGVGGLSGDAPIEEDSGIRVEIVITGETDIYKDVTQFPAPVNGEIHNVQQVVVEGTLDDLHPQTSVTVWGRRSGDRIFAEALLYMDPQAVKKP
jgi:hypothetical protein